MATYKLRGKCSRKRISSCISVNQCEGVRPDSGARMQKVSRVKYGGREDIQTEGGARPQEGQESALLQTDEDVQAEGGARS